MENHIGPWDPLNGKARRPNWRTNLAAVELRGWKARGGRKRVVEPEREMADGGPEIRPSGTIPRVDFVEFR